MPTVRSRVLNPIEQIPDILVHYDGNNQNTITLGTGIQISDVADISANQNNLSQSTSGNQFSVLDPYSNKIGFNMNIAGSRFMDFLNDLVVTGEYTAAFILSDADRTSFVGGNSSTMPNLNTGQAAFYNYQDNGGGFDNITAGSTSSDVLLNFVTRDSGGQHKMFEDGVDVTVAHSSASQVGTYTQLGKRISDGGLDTGGAFGEFVVWNRELTAAERQSITRFLANKWGISI